VALLIIFSGVENGMAKQLAKALFVGLVVSNKAFVESEIMPDWNTAASIAS